MKLASLSLTISGFQFLLPHFEIVSEVSNLSPFTSIAMLLPSFTRKCSIPSAFRIDEMA